MNILSRAVLTASAFKLTGLAAINAQANVVSTQLPTPVVVNNTSVFFDLNSDGNNDVLVGHSSGISGGDSQVDASVLVAASIGVAGDPAGPQFTLPFAAGTLIDASATYKFGNFLAINTDNSPRTGNTGYWANGGAGPASWPGANQAFRGYMGVEFKDAASNPFFGWVDLATKAYDPADLASYEVTVYGYAYETVSGQGIAAGATAVPEPDSLALLAVGAAGLLARKRKALPAAA